MRIAMVLALVVGLILGPVGTVWAQTHADANPTESRPLSVTLDLSSVGGALVGVVAASGLLGLYNTGALVYQGAAFVEALEAGTGLPLPATLLALVLGGMFAKDVVANAVAPFLAADDHPAAAERPKPAH